MPATTKTVSINTTQPIATTNHTPEPIITTSLLRKLSKSNMTETILSRKANLKFRQQSNQTTPAPNLSPTPSATMSRIQSFGRTCLNSLSRNKEAPSSSIMPSFSTTITLKKRQPIGKPNHHPPVRHRKPSGILFARPASPRTPSSPSHQATVPKRSHDQQYNNTPTPRPSLSRRRPLSQFIYIPKPQSSPSSTSTLSPTIQRPHSTFVDSPLADELNPTSLSSSCSSSSTLSSSNTSFSSIKTPLYHHHHHLHHQSDQEQLTALDFLLDDRDHALTKRVGQNPDYFVKKKRMSVPVRSCSGMIPSAQHKQKHQSEAISASTSSFQLNQGRRRLTSFETPLLLPSLFGLMDHQQKEEKAIQAWRLAQESLSIEDAPELKMIDDKTELKWLALRKFIINEIYCTEKSYYELLVLVRTRYMTPMLAASKEKDPLVKFNDIPILFNHLSALIELSEKILAGFTMDHPFASVASSLGYQWLQLHDDWTVFLRYAVHYEANSKTIKRACNNALLLKIEQESLTRRETKRLGMADYLIAPIQRVPRYCLLLKDLLRHTPTTDTDYPPLSKVVHTLTGLAKAMNDTQKLRRRKTISS